MKETDDFLEEIMNDIHNIEHIPKDAKPMSLPELLELCFGNDDLD